MKHCVSRVCDVRYLQLLVFFFLYASVSHHDGNAMPLLCASRYHIIKCNLDKFNVSCT